MLIKIVIVIAMLAIVFSLFRGLYFLTTTKQSDKTVKSLSWRIGLSILLFIILMVAAYFGLLEPHGLPQINKPQ